MGWRVVDTGRSAGRWRIVADDGRFVVASQLHGVDVSYGAHSGEAWTARHPIEGWATRREAVDALGDIAAALWERLDADDRRQLDDHDEAFYREAFTLAETVRRFLRRRTTQRVIDAGMLDDDVTGELVESADRIWLIRTQRIGAARAAPPTDPTH